RRQRQRRIQLGRVGGLALAVALGQARAQRQFALQTAETIADDEALLARGKDADAQPEAAGIADLVALRLGLQVGDRDRGKGAGHRGYRRGIVLMLSAPVVARRRQYRINARNSNAGWPLYTNSVVLRRAASGLPGCCINTCNTAYSVMRM